MADDEPRRRSPLPRLTPGARAAVAVIGILLGIVLIYLGVANVASDDAPPPSSIPATTVPAQGPN